MFIIILSLEYFLVPFHFKVLFWTNNVINSLCDVVEVKFSVNSDFRAVLLEKQSSMGGLEMRRDVLSALWMLVDGESPSLIHETPRRQLPLWWNEHLMVGWYGPLPPKPARGGWGSQGKPPSAIGSRVGEGPPQRLEGVFACLRFRLLLFLVLASEED